MHVYNECTSGLLPPLSPLCVGGNPTLTNMHATTVEQVGDSWEREKGGSGAKKGAATKRRPVIAQFVAKRL